MLLQPFSLHYKNLLTLFTLNIGTINSAINIVPLENMDDIRITSPEFDKTIHVNDEFSENDMQKIALCGESEIIINLEYHDLNPEEIEEILYVICENREDISTIDTQKFKPLISKDMTAEVSEEEKPQIPQKSNKKSTSNMTSQILTKQNDEKMINPKNKEPYSTNATDDTFGKKDESTHVKTTKSQPSKSSYDFKEAVKKKEINNYEKSSLTEEEKKKSKKGHKESVIDMPGKKQQEKILRKPEDDPVVDTHRLFSSESDEMSTVKPREKVNAKNYIESKSTNSGKKIENKKLDDLKNRKRTTTDKDETVPMTLYEPTSTSKRVDMDRGETIKNIMLDKTKTSKKRDLTDQPQAEKKTLIDFKQAAGPQNMKQHDNIQQRGEQHALQPSQQNAQQQQAPQSSQQKVQQQAPQSSQQKKQQQAPQSSQQKVQQQAPQSSQQKVQQQAPQSSQQKVQQQAPQSSQQKKQQQAPQPSQQQQIQQVKKEEQNKSQQNQKQATSEQSAKPQAQSTPSPTKQIPPPVKPVFSITDEESMDESTETYEVAPDTIGESNTDSNVLPKKNGGLSN